MLKHRVKTVLYCYTGRYFLVFWPLESAFTVVPESKVVDADGDRPSVGDECQVKERRSVYSGRVAGIGKLHM